MGNWNVFLKANLFIMDDNWNDNWFHDFVTRENRPSMILGRRYGVFGAIEKLRKP